jgi:hypothetical protein
MTSCLSATLERVQDFLLEPPARVEKDPAAVPVSPPPARVEAVVLGLRSGSGASTIARGVAATLAVADARPVHLVVAGASAQGAVLGGEHAAVVWDVSPSEVERAAAAAARAGVVLAVAPANLEPALAEVVTGMLAERFGRVVLVANGVSDPAPWSGRAAVCVPSSRWGAVLAGRGRRPQGAFGTALDDLAALVNVGT